MEYNNTFVEWVNDLLIHFGVTSSHADNADRWISLLIILLLVAIIDVILRWGVIRALHKVVTKTKIKWDDIIFNSKAANNLCNIITPSLVYMLLPLAFPSIHTSEEFINVLIPRLLLIYIVYCGIRFVNSIFKSIYILAEGKAQWKGKPIKSFLQTGQVIVACIGIILVVSILINKSPAILLTGIGASAAVLMLIFKDSILGLVAGVQISANNMLKVGDWISIPHHGVDGVVEEVALTTVKIRGWDNTLQTIPPYILISEPFDNWQAMFDSGGRRVKRSLNIDMTSVKFVTPQLIEHISQNQVVAPLLNEVMATHNDTYSVTNLDLFMRSMHLYIDHHHKVNHKMMTLVRQLQPSQWGLPIELYFFSSDVRWVKYEQLQAEMISFVVAMAPVFELNIYQAPAGIDLRDESKR